LKDLKTGMAMLGTLVGLICWVWVTEVAAVLLMYSWVLCKRRRSAPTVIIAGA
jgi:hypothetical protein